MPLSLGTGTVGFVRLGEDLVAGVYVGSTLAWPKWEWEWTDTPATWGNVPLSWADAGGTPVGDWAYVPVL